MSPEDREAAIEYLCGRVGASAALELRLGDSIEAIRAAMERVKANRRYQYDKEPDWRIELLLEAAKDQAQYALRGGRYMGAMTVHSDLALTVDFSHYGRMPYWTCDESIALLLARNPDVVNWSSVQALVIASDFAARYRRMREVAERSPEMNFGKTAATPSVLAWARSMDFPVPPPLAEAVNRYRGVAVPNTSLSASPVLQSVEPPTSSRSVLAPLASDDHVVNDRPASGGTSQQVQPVAASAPQRQIKGDDASSKKGRGTEVRWTDEELGNLKAYRAEHGTKKAAERFSISEARVRHLLPQEVAPSTVTAANPFRLKAKR